MPEFCADLMGLSSIYLRKLKPVRPQLKATSSAHYAGWPEASLRRLDAATVADVNRVLVGQQILDRRKDSIRVRRNGMISFVVRARSCADCRPQLGIVGQR